MRILIVEDNERLAGLLRQGLSAAGFATDAVTSAEDAKILLARDHFDLLVLDLGLPGEDGTTLLRELRKGGRTLPVMILTARGGLRDKVDALNAGADDYLAKPFEVEELIARARALLRRRGGLLGEELKIGNLSFDPVGRQAAVEGRPLSLKGREIDLLERLMQRAGRVVPKGVLEGDIIDMAEDAASNLVEVYVHRLRKRLAEARSTANIHTLRGVGYLISDAP